MLDADEVLNCPFFSSLLTSRPLHRRPFVGATAIGVVAGLGVMFGLIFLVSPRRAPPVTLQAEASAPPTVFQEEGLEIKVSVVNRGKQPARHVRIRLAGPEIRDLTLQAVEPQEVLEESTAQYVLALLGDIEPGESGSALFRFTSQRTGPLKLTAMITAANVPRPTTIPVESEVMP